MHESPTKSSFISLKLNLEIDLDMFAHFLTFSFLLSLEDFTLFVFDFFNDYSHEVVISNFFDHNSYEHVASKSNTFEGVECESFIKEPLFKSHFLNIDKKEIENMNKGGWKTQNHVELG